MNLGLLGKRAGAVTAAATALLLWTANTAQAESRSYLVNSRGNGGVYDSGSVFACDTKAEDWGVRTRYWTSNGVYDYVGDANGSSSGCGSESPAGGGRVTSYKVCAGVSGLDTTCTGWVNL